MKVNRRFLLTWWLTLYLSFNKPRSVSTAELSLSSFDRPLNIKARFCELQLMTGLIFCLVLKHPALRRNCWLVSSFPSLQSKVVCGGGVGGNRSSYLTRVTEIRLRGFVWGEIDLNRYWRGWGNSSQCGNRSSLQTSTESERKGGASKWCPHFHIAFLMMGFWLWALSRFLLSNTWVWERDIQRKPRIRLDVFLLALSSVLWVCRQLFLGPYLFLLSIFHFVAERGGQN